MVLLPRGSGAVEDRLTARRRLDAAAKARAEALPCWHGPVEAVPVAGGMSNRNFRVRDRGASYFVRIGGDDPEHNVFREDEVAASRAAAEADVAPPVIHAEPGAMVFQWIEGCALAPGMVGHPDMLPRVAALLRHSHREVGHHLRGRTLAFWVFHALRDYAERLGAAEHLDAIALLEEAAQPVEIVFGHNDLVPGNFVDDGERLWLVDWEYAGYNSPLFDLANLATNNELDEEAQERLLALYFGRAADDGLRRRFSAMCAASLLREVLWCEVALRVSTIEFDFATYTATNRARYDRALAAFQEKK